MRRHDREITDAAQIDAVIRACDCCRLGFADGGSCYIVPMNFGFVREGGRRIFYFHSAREGRKLELAQRNGTAGFELDTGHGLNTADAPCGYSFRFQSVIGTGRISLVQEPAEKLRAREAVMAQCTGRSGWEFPAGAADSVAILKLTVQEISCKVHG